MSAPASVTAPATPSPTASPSRSAMTPPRSGPITDARFWMLVSTDVSVTE